MHSPRPELGCLFYRTDIIVDEHQLDLLTWEDVYEMLFCRRRDTTSTIHMLLATIFHSCFSMAETCMTNMRLPRWILSSIHAFKEYADLYIKYKIPYAANFYQRFRNEPSPLY